MAKEIVAWCDVHLAQDERVVAHTLGVAFRTDNKGVDLCDTCTKSLVEPLADIIEELGQRFEAGPPPPSPAKKREQSPAKSEPIQCPKCGLTVTGSSGLSSHLKNRHAMNGVGDLTEPIMPGEENFPEPCPEPGCNRRFRNGTGLASHRRSAHGHVVERDTEQEALL